VRERLIRLGVDDERLVVIAHGEAESHGETAESEMAEDRRVEFTIIGRAAPQAAPEE
jgi:outer membrane protein OmpA-like peptidoglycan-associated protein